MKLCKKYLVTVVLLIISLSCVFAFAACGNDDNKTDSETDTRVLWGTLTGVITDYNQSPVTASPVAGVTVKSGDETATTDENGKYSIEVYDNGATVTFEKEGRITQSKTFKSSSFRNDTANYDFIMYSSAKVQGTVKDKEGKAVSGASVEIGIQKTETDEQGKFEFAEVIATSMIIKVTYNGKSVIKPLYTEQMLTGSVTTEIIIG